MLQKQFIFCHEYHNGLQCQRKDALISLVGRQQYSGTHLFSTVKSQQIPLTMPICRKIVIFEITNSEFKIAFLRLAGYFTVNF